MPIKNFCRLGASVVAFRFSFVFRRIFMREHNVYALVHGIKTSSAYKNSERRHSCAEPKMRGNSYACGNCNANGSSCQLKFQTFDYTASFFFPALGVCPMCLSRFFGVFDNVSCAIPSRHFFLPVNQSRTNSVS